MAKFECIFAVVLLEFLFITFGDACCEPDAYTVGYNALVAESFDDGPLIYTWEMESAINRKGNIAASITTISYDNGTIETTRAILDYGKGFYWEIKGLNCVKRNLTGVISDGCLPDNAVSQGKDRAAFSDIPLEVETFSWFDPEDSGNVLVGNISITVLTHDCRPVQEMFFGQSVYNGKYYYCTLSGTFQDFTYGIMNPDKYFTVPQFCPGDLSSPIPVTLNTKGYWEFSPLSRLHNNDFMNINH